MKLIVSLLIIMWQYGVSKHEKTHVSFNSLRRHMHAMYPTPGLGTIVLSIDEKIARTLNVNV